MSENKDGAPVPMPIGELPDEQIPDWLRGLKPEDVDLAPAAPEATVAKVAGSDWQPIPPPLEKTSVIDETDLPVWLRPDAMPVPANERVIDGSAVTAPEAPPVTPEAPELTVVSAKIEPKARKSSEALEKEKNFLNEFKLAHEILAQAAACAERPWPESVEAIKGRRELKAAELSSLKETMNGVGLAPGDELQVRAQREKNAQTYFELQRTIDGLNVAGLEKRASAAISEGQRLKTESSEVYAQIEIENIKVAQEVKAWTQAEETARANGLPEAGLLLFQLQRQNAEDRLTAIKSKAGYLFLETSKKNVEAEQAVIDFEAAQVNIQRLQAEKVQARFAAENWQKRLVDPERQLAGLRQQTAGLEQEISGLDNILRTENIYTEVSEIADAFDQLNPNFIHQGGVEADLLQAMREGFPGTQVERDYIFTLAQQPEYANMSIPQLREVFRDRVGKMNRILELEAAGLPEDRARKLLTDPQYPDFPASFRIAVESTLRGRSFLAELPQGSDPVLSRANRAQRKVYTDVMSVLGLQPQTPEAAETLNVSLIQRGQSGELAKQMAEIYAGEPLPAELQTSGAEYGTDAWETWKEDVMRWSRDKVRQQQLDNYADPKLAAVEAEAATKLTELEGQVAAEANRATLAEAETASREDARRMAQQQVENLTPLAGEVNRQIESAINSVDDVVWGLVPEDQKRELTILELQPGETVRQRKEKILRAAQAAWEAKLNTGSKEADKAHQKEVAEDQRMMADYHSGKLTLEQLVQRLRKTGGVAGVGARDKKPEELAATGLAVVDAEAQQVRRTAGVNPADARRMAEKTSVMNTALEGAGILSAGMGGILDGGFNLAIESMFSAGR